MGHSCICQLPCYERLNGAVNVLPRPLQDVVDLVAGVRLVGVLHREARLLPTGKEVLVVVLGTVVVVVIVVGVSVAATRRLQVSQRPGARHTPLRGLSTAGRSLRR